MPNITPDAFRRWNECIADIAATRNRDRVPELLVRACNALVQTNDATVGVFGRNIQPLLLYDNVSEGMHSKVIQSYFDGAYLLDPYYRAAIDGIDSGAYHLSEVAPPGFRKSAYYLRYYKDTETSDEIGFISHFADGCFGLLFLDNAAGQPNFTKSEVERLRLAQPYVHEVFANHWEHLKSSGSSGRSALHSQLEVALGLFGNSVLTTREAEVVRMYLQGHSTNSISERLDISTHTVSMHRKNAYSKLDIKSQFELFHLFIDSLSCFDPDNQRDPLRGYLGID